MRIKLIIMFAGAAAMSFAAAFLVVILRAQTPRETQASGPSEAPQTAVSETLTGVPVVLSANVGAGQTEQENLHTSLSENQLKALIYDIQEKTQRYNQKLEQQSSQQERMQMTADMLKKDIENLNKLRTELVSILAQLRQQQQSLQQSVLQIQETEKTNLRSIATTFDKMDPSSAAGIAENMCRNSQTDDAVKIIYYMNDRTAAKLLAELNSVDSKLAAGVCDRLKRVKEQK